MMEEELAFMAGTGVQMFKTPKLDPAIQMLAMNNKNAHTGHTVKPKKLQHLRKYKAQFLLSGVILATCLLVHPATSLLVMLSETIFFLL